MKVKFIVSSEDLEAIGVNIEELHTGASGEGPWTDSPSIAKRVLEQKEKRIMFVQQLVLDLENEEVWLCIGISSTPQRAHIGMHVEMYRNAHGGYHITHPINQLNRAKGGYIGISGDTLVFYGSSDEHGDYNADFLKREESALKEALEVKEVLYLSDCKSSENDLVYMETSEVLRKYFSSIF